MLHAYDEIYLDDAMRNLGDAFDYAANNCGMELDKFMELFIVGGVAEQFGSGVPRYVSGMSGIELVWEVVERSKWRRSLPEADNFYDCSPELFISYGPFGQRTSVGFIS